MNTIPERFELQCPLPLQDYPRILMGHGGGGRLTQQLIERMFRPAFASDDHESRHDAARLLAGGTQISFTTDSFVVHPLFFPGGDIGSLAVTGTVNDLAMSGATPRWLTLGMIIEEGFPTADLWSIVQSIQQAAGRTGVQIVSGDTKVVERGKADGLYLNTSGIGIREHRDNIHPSAIQTGDVILVNGDIGRHGIAVMSVREGLSFESPIESDVAPLHELVAHLLSAGVPIHCLRDLTRGGLAGNLNDISGSAAQHFHIEEDAVPLDEAVRGACEILGLDPLYVACEGRLAAFVPSTHAAETLRLMHAHPQGQGAAVIGVVKSACSGGQVTLQSRIGATRVLDMLSGEQLPRIC